MRQDERVEERKGEERKREMNNLDATISSVTSAPSTSPGGEVN